MLEAKQRPAFYGLNEDGDGKPIILSWETFCVPCRPEVTCQRLWPIDPVFMATWVERQYPEGQVVVCLGILGLQTGCGFRVNLLHNFREPYG